MTALRARARRALRRARLPDAPARRTGASPTSRRSRARDFAPRRPAADAVDRGRGRAVRLRRLRIELVFVDGRFAPRLVEPAGCRRASSSRSLAAALAARPELVERATSAGTPTLRRSPFAALNTALFARRRAASWCRAASCVETPIHLLFIARAGAARRTAIYPAHPDRRRRGSQAHAWSRATPAPGAATSPAPVTELVGRAGAVVDHYKLQRESRAALPPRGARVWRDRAAATVSTHSFSLGGALVRNDVQRACSTARAASAILNGLYLVDGRQLVDTHMRVEHVAPHCAQPRALQGHPRRPGARRSSTAGSSSTRARRRPTPSRPTATCCCRDDALVNTNPQLEIFADDVKCTHGSTVGQLDDDAVFYLRSRGIGEEAAQEPADLRLRQRPRRARSTRRPACAQRRCEEFLLRAGCPQGDVVRAGGLRRPGAAVQRARARPTGRVRRRPRCARDFPILAPAVARPAARLPRQRRHARRSRARCSTRIERLLPRATTPTSHRGVHRLSQRATAAYEAARETSRGASSARRTPSEIVFVRGTTEAINLVARELRAAATSGPATRS